MLSAYFFSECIRETPYASPVMRKKKHQFVLLCHLTLDFSVSVCHVNLSTSNIYVLQQPDCQHLFRDRFWAKELNCTHQAYVLRSRLKRYLNKRRSAYAIGTLSSYITNIPKQSRSRSHSMDRLRKVVQLDVPRAVV